MAALALGLLASPVLAQAQTRIGGVDTTFRFLGSNDRVVVDRYDDPDVPNVSCYVSRAETGGIKGSLGLAEDPSRFSIACRAVGPVTWPTNLPKKQRIFTSSLSVFFKTLEVYRLLDPDKKVILYVVISSRLKEGSPFNSITAVATEPSP
ncbi:MAG TPA: CreA family protein [Caulobacteraceae bacterium]|jgi:CreA protein|nr:CreA family protein [Caulobacteraceae bacterium]